MEKLVINREKAVQDDFLGTNAVYHCFAQVPDHENRHYDDELADLEADRAKDLGIKIARTYFPWWAWTRKDGWNWDNAKMQGVYAWLKRMKDRDIEVAANCAWCLPNDIIKSGFEGDAPFADGGADWQTACERFAEYVSEMVHQIVEVRGFDNLKYLLLFTEPSSGMQEFRLWEEASRAIHNKLVADNRRHLVKLVGPNENCRAYDTSALLKYAGEHADDFLDFYSGHIYVRSEMEDESGVHSGKRSAVMKKPGFRIGQFIDIKPNTTYNMEAYIRVIGEDYKHLTGNVLAGVFTVEQERYKNIHPGRFQSGGSEPTTRLTTDSVVSIDPAPYGNQWIKVTNTFTTPDEVSQAVIGVFADVKGDFITYADDISLCEEGSDVNIVKDPSFEAENADWRGIVSNGVAYDIYYDWKLYAEMMIDSVPRKDNFWYDEFNTAHNTEKSKTDLTRGARIVMAYIGMMNAGVRTSLIWTAFDQQWPNNHTTNDDSFDNGIHKCGVMEYLKDNKAPAPAYYAMQIMGKYIGKNVKVYPELETAEKVHAVLTEDKNGEITVVIASLRNEAVDFEIDLGKICDKPLNRRLFNPDTIVPDENATPIKADKVFEKGTKVIADTLPHHGVAVYTTHTY